MKLARQNNKNTDQTKYFAVFKNTIFTKARFCLFENILWI